MIRLVLPKPPFRTMTALGIWGCLLGPPLLAWQAPELPTTPGEQAEAALERLITTTAIRATPEGDEVLLFVVRADDGRSQFAIETIDLDLTPDAVRAGLVQADLDAREAFLDDLVLRLGLRDAAARNAENWLRHEATVPGSDLAWSARLVLRDVERRREYAAPKADPLARLLQNESTATLGFTPALRWPSPQEQAAPQAVASNPGPLGLEVSAQTSANPKTVRVSALVQTERFNRFPVANLDAYGDYTFELRCGPESTQLRVLEVPEVDRGAKPGEGQKYNAQVREYHGASLEAILSAYPDLRTLLPFSTPALGVRPTLPRADVLGVYVGDVTAEERVAVVGSDGTQVQAGMRVMRIEPGTIAESMGVARGSLILKVCGEPIVNGNSISQSLSATRARQEAGGDEGAIRVEWLDPWGRRQTRIWRGSLAR